MKHLYILLAILVFIPPALAQNCTTQAAMNTQNIAGGNSVIGNSAAQTITVNLVDVFTSGTGYATIYNGNATNGSFTGSYKILMGNGTAQLVLDQTTRTNGAAAANGSTIGTYVSDVAVVKNSARNYTISWTTPGYASTTNLSYGDDADTATLLAYGYNWIHQDTVTGVTSHAVTIDNLDLTVADNTGKYFFAVWSECFTSGAPDRTTGAMLPRDAVPIANLGRDPIYDQLIQVASETDAPPTVPANLDTFTLQGFSGISTSYVVIPQQDGTHPGFRVFPGQTLPLNFYIFDTIRPGTNWTAIGDNGATIQLEDWNGIGTGLLSLGKNGTVGGGATPIGPWSGGNITIRRGSGGGSLSLTVAANAPTTGTACTNLYGAAITLDDGTPACAYPIRIKATRWFANSAYGCGATITCGPPGTPATPIASVPYTAEIWAIVFNPPAVSTGTVGAWTNPYTGMLGIPCEKAVNSSVDKPNGGIAAAGCKNQSAGITGVSGQTFTFDTGEQNNCQFNGSINENTYTITSTPPWFYDNPYVCHVIDTLYNGGSGMNDNYEKHILGIYWQQSGFPRTVEATMVNAYGVSAAATVTDNSFCTGLSTPRGPFCSTLTIPVGTSDVSAIANGLAAGIRYRACINIDNPNNTAGAGSYSYGCYAFPFQTPKVVPVSFAGGNIPASTNVQIIVMYTASATRNVYSFPCGVGTPPNCSLFTNVTVASTCPTSGNCSVNVPSPSQITNAVGYDVYARVNGVGTYYRQNTAGPVPIGTAFNFGTATYPFITSGGYAIPIGMIGTNVMNGSITNVLAADNVAHTITIDTQQGLSVIPSNSNNATIYLMRQFAGIPADATSSANTVVCAGCDFSAWDGYKGIPTWATVYCGVTTGGLGPFPNYALYSLAPNRGSQIQSVDVPNHTIHLSTGINCGPGVNFEIRQEGTLAGNNRIFDWTKGSYDVWKRFNNYIGADAVMWLAQDTVPSGANFSAPNPGASYVWTKRRESALSVMSCQSALHVLNDLASSGNTTALSPSVVCQSPSTAGGRLQALFSMIDLMSNGNRGRGASAGSFLDGLVLDAVINWWLDPLMGVQSNTAYLYWSKRLIDMLWNTYYAGKGSFNASYCGGMFPHEFAYDMESVLVGICNNAANPTTWYPSGYGVGSTAPVADYWSINGNIFPAYAFFYQYTGNATIPNSSPATTYGQAYQDMASWAFVQMASMSGWVNASAGLKTLGEMGIWQDQAIGWMGGTSAVPPPTPLMITSSSLPDGTVGAPYAASMTATGGTPPYSWTSIGLPSGLSMNTSGNISGSPLAAGTSSPSFTVTDSVSATASTSLSVTITAAPPPPLVITTNSLPSGTVGVAYSASVTATGGTPPYTWTAVGLPSGLVMNASGNISGTPLAAANVTPQFTVTDAATVTTSTGLSLAIAPAAAPSAAPGFSPPIISERLGGSDRIGLSH